MTKITKVSGIDMASKKFDVVFMIQIDNGDRVIKGSRSFENNVSGFEQYWSWSQKRGDIKEVLHVMEATGVYHENLCYYLHQKEAMVCVELAQKVKYFAKSLNIKTKTDKTDAKMIAIMGLNRELKLWKPLSKNFKQIRDLSRTVLRLKKMKTANSSQLHASKSANNSMKQIIEVHQQLDQEYQKIIEQCENEILKLVDKDQQLKDRIDRITLIKGINIMTVVKILAETDGFRNCSSIKKLTSYAGLDVSQKQSGQYKGKSKISKKGNVYIRTALYMPALSASQHDPKFNEFYERLKERMPRKRQAIVAVMRKLLITIYTLWKNQQDYNPKHQW